MIDRAAYRFAATVLVVLAVLAFGIAEGGAWLEDRLRRTL